MSEGTLLRRSLPVALVFALLSAIALSPLIFHLSTQVLGIDYFHFNWNFWWLRHALQSGQDPYYTQWVLVPFEHNLAFHSLTPAWFPVYLILEPLAGSVATVNLIMGLAVALTGFTTWYFLRRQGSGAVLALIGGVALAISPYMRSHIVDTHLNLITLFWMPVGLLLWDAVVGSQRRQPRGLRAVLWALLTGATLWVTWQTDLVVLIWVAVLLGPYALLTLFETRDGRERLRLVLLGGLAIIVTLVLAWFLGPLQPLLAFDSDSLTPVNYTMIRWFALPPQIWKLTPELVEPQGMGVLLVALTVLALFVPSKDRRRWFWLAVAIPPLLLALGPDITILGVRIPLPFRILHWIQGGHVRTPVRYIAPATFALIVFLARTYAPWVRRLRPASLRPALAGALLLAFLLDYRALAPLPTRPAPPPYDFYAMMREEDADYVVLDIPPGPQTGLQAIGAHPEAVLYALTHEKRTVSGLLSRIPDLQVLYYEISPVFGWLTGQRPLDASRVNTDLARMTQGEWGEGEVTAPLGYVVVHQDWLETGQAEEIFALFNAHAAFCYLGTERAAALYRAATHPKGCTPTLAPEAGPGVYRVDVGAPDDAGAIGHGWYWREDFGGVTSRWAGGQTETLIYANVPPGAGYELAIRAMPFHEARTVRVTVGDVVDGTPTGTRLDTFDAQPGDWGVYSVTIPADLVERVGGRLVIALSADEMRSAAEVGLSADERPLTLAYDWFEFRAQPGAEENGA